MENLCVLASPQSFETKKTSMLQKLALPLSEEGVLSLVLHIPPQHPVSIPPSVTLLMSGHCDFLPLHTNYDITMTLHLCCYWHCHTTANSISALQPPLICYYCYCSLQLRSIIKTESTVFNMMHLSFKSLTAISIYTVYVAAESTLCHSALLPTLHYAPQHLIATSLQMSLWI